jgi:dihydroorotase-like cyclic amidohydrolase
MIDGAAFDAKVAAADGVARVDVALWGGLVPGDLDRLDELAARGVVGFKAFMSASGVAEFKAADDLTLLEGHEPPGAPAGRVARTILRGRTVARDGRVVGEPCGRVVRRGP